MAITSEEFVVKVKADLTAYKKEMEAMKKKYSTMESEVKGIKQKYKEEEKIQKMKEKSEAKQNKDRNTSFKELFKTVVKLGIITESFKQIGKVIQEGRENLYWYSKLNNGLYAELADKRTSAIQAFGNAIAAFESMFFNGISPYIEKVFKWLTEFMNRLSRLIANIFDLPTYLQARDDILVEWSKNIKETRMLISGFDKLNIFNGTKNTVPENMFYEVERGGDTTASAWNDLVIFLKESISNVWTWLTDIWATFKEWWRGTAWPAIKEWWNGVTTEDEDEEGNIITRLVEPGFKHKLIDWFSGIWTKLKEWWENTAKPWLEELWETIKKFLSDEFQKLIDSISGQYDKWYHSDNGLATFVRSNTEAGTKMPIAGAGTAGAGYPDAGEGSFSNFLVELWRYIFKKGKYAENADGGVYTKPTLGLVGEYSNAMSNPELITPQSLLDERLQLNNRDLLSAFNQMSNNIIGAIQGMNMEVRIGDDVIARSASRGQEAYYRQMGRPLIR